MRCLLTLPLCLMLALPASGQEQSDSASAPLPEARWDFREESDEWSSSAVDALKSHGKPLVEETPDDIARWCPGYAAAEPADRRAFWVGLLSALAKHESTWKPGAVGGDGKWFGLLQISPATAKDYGCRARTGSALRDGAANLSCAIRIMARTVPRDGVVHAAEPDWGGVAADWGPMRQAEKRAEMAGWLRQQDYCQVSASPGPQPRETAETKPAPKP